MIRRDRVLEHYAIEYLRAENRVLHARLGHKRLRFTDAERRLLAEKGLPLGRMRLAEIASLATPETILRWYRERVAAKYDGSRTRGNPGRAPAHGVTVEHLLTMARENPSWGYTRLRGALNNLGVDLGRSTIQRILAQHGIEPAPLRGRTIPWETFLKAHWGAIAAADFFNVEVLTRGGLVRYLVLFVIDLKTRRIHIAGVTSRADGDWMAQTARSLTDAVAGPLTGFGLLMVDRDPLYTAHFRSILQAAGVQVLRLPAYSRAAASNILEQPRCTCTLRDHTPFRRRPVRPCSFRAMTRRAYDHRIEEQILRAGDPDLFPELQIPRSTAVSWIRRGLGQVVSLDRDDEGERPLRNRVATLEGRIAMLTAVLRLVLALLRVSGFKLELSRVADAAGKRRLLGAIERARRCMPLWAALRVLRLSSARYHAWVRADDVCALDDRPSCPRSKPQRLAHGEVEAIGDMIQSTEHRHMSIRGLALYAQRVGKVFAHPGTWGRLIRERGWRRPRLRLYPAKPKVGLRARAPNEAWHVDVTILKLLDGTKAYVHAGIDNFSRRILAWTVAPPASTR